MIFDDVKHEYQHKGEIYTSTTQILKKYGLSADYQGIPQSVLDQAAKKGKAVHKALELFIKGDQTITSFSEEAELLAKYVAAQNINLITATSEMIIYDETYKVAGTVDFTYEDGQDYYVADFKTTSTLHMDAVAWQLSIYNFILSKGDLVKYYSTKLKVFHFTNGRMFVKDVYTIDYDEVTALLTANLNNDSDFTYARPNKVISDAQQQVIYDTLSLLEDYTQITKQLEKTLASVTQQVKDEMIKHKQTHFTSDQITLTYVAGQQRESINRKKLQEFFNSINEKLDPFIVTKTTTDSIRVDFSKKAKEERLKNANAAAVDDNIDGGANSDDTD